MSKIEKLISKIFNGSSISYDDAERILLYLNFDLDVTGSHHIFRKRNYSKTVSLKRRPQLLAYQIKDLKQVLLDHNYEK
ncbi:type II toxin-antitoxin system HicA family toxin [Candidatus Dependentiae bacterium]|nr:type II toxin-antitoxin system HicA family toxin [Candidatus Dependentiae bacterium]